MNKLSWKSLVELSSSHRIARLCPLCSNLLCREHHRCSSIRFRAETQITARAIRWECIKQTLKLHEAGIRSTLCRSGSPGGTIPFPGFSNVMRPYLSVFCFSLPFLVFLHAESTEIHTISFCIFQHHTVSLSHHPSCQALSRVTQSQESLLTPNALSLQLIPSKQTISVFSAMILIPAIFFLLSLFF